MSKVVIIGGGAAGMMAAITAAKNKNSVILLEKNERLGRKMLITGKGRCNVTNNCSNDVFISNIPVNGRFLYSSINAFSTADTMDFFEKYGTQLKTERGNRVFPISDHSSDIVGAMKKALHSEKVNIVNDTAMQVLTCDGAVCGVKGKKSTYDADAVVVATGGISYPLTGSTGDGYRFAKELGHTVTELSPSLVPIETKETIFYPLSGLALKNISVSLFDNKSHKIVFTDFGEMLLTHFGLSGPVILSLSSHIRKVEENRYTICVDLKPALSEKQLNDRLLREFVVAQNSEIKTVMKKLLPSNLAEPFCIAANVNPLEKINSLTREHRQIIVQTLKKLCFTVKSFRPIDEAIVTSGGIKISEISPKTMESKLVKGLYFAGEVIDVDAYTGGFNLQTAFSTGYLAGSSIY